MRNSIRENDNPAGFDAIIILAHLMEKDGTLGIETCMRADKAVELYKKQRSGWIILTGWNYRNDSELCISDAIASYLKSKHGLNDEIVLIDRRSRDTVGDAIFSKRKFSHLLSNNRLCIVTSDYHAERAKLIFQFVFGPSIDIWVIGITTREAQSQIVHERESLEAFAHTFVGVNSGDDGAIFNALVHRHPFYNGEVHPIFQNNFLK